MQKYNFRLQKVLDMRTAKEDEAKRIFKEAQKEKMKEEERLSSLKGNYYKYNVCNKDESLLQQKIRCNYLSSLSVMIQDSEKDLQVKEHILEEKRKELSEKQKDRKIVEKLKEKKLDAFIKEQNYIEQKNNDEFALYGFMRRFAERR